MRSTFRLIMILAMIITGQTLSTVRAVTDKEMEEARTITAFWYLRYANDGAGYMESGKTPTTMAALEKMLKETEKTNLKSFKAVAAPADYASWDKKKLVEYWGNTFFNQPGLLQKGKIAKSRVRKKLDAMAIAAPAPQPETAPAAPESKPGEDKPVVTPASAAPVGPTAEGLPDATRIVDQAMSLDSAALAIEEASEETRRERRSSSSSTWIYIVALVVLVGVVVWLVIFASRTMQQNGSESRETPEDDEREARRRRQADVVPVNVADPHPAAAQQRVVDEISRRHQAVVEESEAFYAARREVKTLRAECDRLTEDNVRLQGELAAARRDADQLRERLRALSAAAAAPVAPAPAQPAVTGPLTASARPAAPAPAPAPAPAADTVEDDSPREIFLGRVNPRGLFVRADKRPVAEKTVFVLTTKDGYTGTFRVLQVAEVIDRCLDNPDHYLAGGCSAPDILATENAEQIRTLQAGTAIFEDGCWRMIRKSKIVYE